jgi:phytoene dehydrogenase-like protein
MDHDAFERFAVGENPPVDIPMGLERYKNRLIKLYPQADTSIRRFFSSLGELCEASRLFNDNNLFLYGQNRACLEMILTRGLRLEQKLNTYRFLHWTLKDLFDDCGLIEPVRRLLYGHNGDFAESESQLSLPLYAAVTGFLHQGAYMPMAGFGRLVEALRHAIEKNGEVLAGKRVTRLVTDHRKVTQVDCADGSRYPCQAVISTLSPRLTARLLPGSLAERYTYRSSNTLNCFFMGVTGLPNLVEDLRLKNLWWQEGSQEVSFDNPDTARSPQAIYLGSHTAHQQPVQAASECQIFLDVTAFTPGNFEQALATFQQGTEAYTDYKHVVIERLIQGIERYLYPGFHSHVRFMELFTPLDIHHELGAENGNTYGRRVDPASFADGSSPSLPLANLHMACASAGLEGITQACQTATYWCHRLTGSRI